jgi:hypothetical protein
MPLAVVSLCLSGSACSSPERDWQSARKTNSIESYDSYLRSYPDSQFSIDARALLEALEWKRAESADRKDLYEQFLGKYPHSRFLEDAKTRKAAIDWNDAQTVGTVDSYRRVLETYPEGALALAARASIEMAGHFDVSVARVARSESGKMVVVIEVARDRRASSERSAGLRFRVY